jgi:hypothetical protein
VLQQLEKTTMLLDCCMAMADGVFSALEQLITVKALAQFALS